MAIDFKLDQLNAQAERFASCLGATGSPPCRCCAPWCSGSTATCSTSPARAELTRVEQQERDLQRKVSEVRAIVANLAAFEQELTDLEDKLKLALRQLPDSKELPVLLTDVTSLGKDAGLEFRLFRPREEQARQFYAEVPIDIEFSGGYHDIAACFFDKVSKLPRIVNISRMEMSLAGTDAGATVLEVKGQATKCSASSTSRPLHPPRRARSRGAARRSERPGRREGAREGFGPRRIADRAGARRGLQ